MTTQSADAPAPATPVSTTKVDIPTIVARVRKTFATGRTRDVEWRKQQLRALERLVVDNEAAIADALHQDLGRNPFEAWLADIASTASEAHDAAKNVGKWTRRKHRLLEMAQLPGRGWIEYEPFGTVLVIGAWNFPFALTLGPAVGAIAAGNAVVLKPSEVAPASSALMAELVPRYLDSDADRGDRGRRRGQPGAHRAGLRQAVLHRRYRDRPQGLRGGGEAPDARSRSSWAARARSSSPPTPTSTVAAKRIAWTKLINSGQICIAPDYVLADASIRDQLVDEIRRAVDKFEAEEVAGKRIVNERHFDRLVASLAATKGEVAIGGGSDAGGGQDPADGRRGPRPWTSR